MRVAHADASERPQRASVIVLARRFVSLMLTVAVAGRAFPERLVALQLARSQEGGRSFSPAQQTLVFSTSKNNIMSSHPSGHCGYSAFHAFVIRGNPIYTQKYAVRSPVSAKPLSHKRRSHQPPYEGHIAIGY